MDNTNKTQANEKRLWQWDKRKIKSFPVFHRDGISWSNSSEQTVSVQNRKNIIKTFKTKNSYKNLKMEHYQ